MKKLIDVSSYNGLVDWKKAKCQGVYGAILKVIRKDLTRDNQFNNNYKGCESAGMPWGVYNYSYATTVSKAKSDMNLVCNILDKISKKHFLFGVWFDIEDKTQEKLSQAQIASIINAAEKVVTSRGYPFGVYTGLAFYKAHIHRDLVECKNWWIARYYNGYDVMPIKTNPNETYKPISGIVAWQYTSSGRFNPAICKGNEGNVDLNVMYKGIQSDKKGDGKVAVKIGSARINEKGTVTGGKAGDQTGGEVSTQNWYLHSKGWVVIRPKDKVAAEKIAKCMEMACANDNIGYCQTHRDDLRKISAKYNYSADKVKDKVEVDCSALVRVCCLYAGINVGDFNTASQVGVLKGTGKFDIITDKSVCGSSDKLRRGDILVTKTKGHTVVVLTNGKISESGSDESNEQNEAKKILTVDGKMGKETTKRAQEVFKTPVDGKISNQIAAYKSICKGVLSAEWSQTKKGGSVLIKAIQKWVGAKQDGYIGPDTIKKLQKKLGTSVDGKLDNPSQCIKAFQKWLNNQK